jgi:uncharacterized protein YbjT (DUF2867 family)
LSQRVFVTGGTGYIGSRLIPILAQRGHEVIALVRPGSERRLSGAVCRPVLGDALDGASYLHHLRVDDTFIQLVGVPHPSPANALIPFYWLAELIPRTREGARRLGLVTVEQMLKALARAVDRPPAGVAVMDVSAIRAAQ